MDSSRCRIMRMETKCLRSSQLPCRIMVAVAVAEYNLNNMHNRNHDHVHDHLHSQNHIQPRSSRAFQQSIPSGPTAWLPPATPAARNSSPAASTS
ncbi:hypothetical protein EMPG_15582 [Blastomyces silverae]|uniref:Uncharacterized protein n=1 Tax=Blastomyces silverae TaxID=2060906 RepID=A0A0H1BCB6_9EURO|nr:hypothetical protein EMPG_15582 [Blastomyces silverae]